MDSQRSTRLLSIGLVLGLCVINAEAADHDDPEDVLSATVESYSTGPDRQLEELIGILINENPDILAARTRTRSRQDRAGQARSLPDLQLNYRYFVENPETRVGPQEQGLELIQAIPWKGKRGLQGERAELEALSSAWQSRDLERFLVADLKRAYYNASFLEEALTINDEERDLLEKFESIALKRYATGEGIQQNVVKVQTDLSRLDDEEVALRARRSATLRRIAELIGRAGADLALEPVYSSIVPAEYDLAALERTAATRHPRVRSIEQAIEADAAWSKRQALEGRPDFRLGLGYTVVGDRDDPAGMLVPPEDNGQDIVALMVGIDLPVYRGRIRAGIDEAENSRLSNQARLQASRNSLLYSLQEAVLRLESLDERGRLYDEVLIPQAEESLASAEAAYTTGRLDFLNLLDAERILFQVRLTYYRLVSDYQIALADIEFSLGEPFPVNGTVSEANDGNEGSLETAR